MDLSELDSSISTMTDIPKTLRTVVPVIIEYLKSEEMTTMRKEQYAKYLDLVDSKLPNFSNRFPFLLQKLLDDPNDTEILYFFISKLEENDNSKNEEQRTKEVAGHLSNIRKNKLNK